MPVEDLHQSMSNNFVSKRPQTFSLQPARPTGVLAVHLKELIIFNSEFLKLFDQYKISIYVRIILGSCVKCSCVHTIKSIPSTIYLDDLKHFSVQVDPDRTTSEGNVRLELVGFDRPDIHRIISRQVVSIHELVKNLYVVETCKLVHTEKGVADLEAEFCFSYGCFGYGYSNQIENLQSRPLDQITHSMFCRLPPPPDRQKDNLDVMTCRPVGHPPFINFTEKAVLVDMDLEFGSETELRKGKMSQEPTILITKMRKRLRQLQTEYEKETSRKGRLLYLRHLMKNDHLASEDAGEISTLKHLKLKRRAATHSEGPLKQDQPLISTQQTADETDVTVADMATVLMSAPGVVLSRAKQQKKEPFIHRRRPEMDEVDLRSKESDDAIKIESTDSRPQEAPKNESEAPEVPEELPEKSRWPLIKWFISKGSAMKRGATVTPDVESTEMGELTNKEEMQHDKSPEASGSSDKAVGGQGEKEGGGGGTLSSVIEGVSNMLHRQNQEHPATASQSQHTIVSSSTGRRRSSFLESAKRLIMGGQKASVDTSLHAPRVMLTPPSPCPSESSDED